MWTTTLLLGYVNIYIFTSVFNSLIYCKQSALRIVDGLATNLPPTQVFPALFTLVAQFYQSPDANLRRGAILALGVCVEGCSEFMTPLMADIWPIIEAGLSDPDAGVRKATCVAVSCLCEWLEDDCASKHAILVPVRSIIFVDSIGLARFNP